MEESTSREKVLKKVRDALIDKTEVPYPILDMESSVFLHPSDTPDVQFAEEFIKAGGKFVYCESEDEFLTALQSFILENNWPVLFCADTVLQQFLKNGGIPYETNMSETGNSLIAIHRCESLVARTGTILLSSNILPGRRAARIPQVHLVVATASQIVPEMKLALQNLRKKYSERLPSEISLITGLKQPEVTPDKIEAQTNTSRELYLFLIDDTTVSE